ncbi:phage holin family protein [Anoxybacillus flavithermus]|uniref:phage holin family protein n=1 Tax=Anoxybacillus flavithermus TaxID=33934 RepID=UPI001E3EAF54|nr:phage holin family protein [Anoxybacillus flavithermus]
MEAILSVEFTAYVALAVLLYAIREATNIPNRYIPIVAVVLGVAFSIFEKNAFSFEVLVQGLQICTVRCWFGGDCEICT